MARNTVKGLRQSKPLKNHPHLSGVDAMITPRIPVELRDRLNAAAKKDRMSLNAYCWAVLCRAAGKTLGESLNDLMPIMEK